MSLSAEPTFPAALEDRYEPIRSLGASGMGTAFQAREVIRRAPGLDPAVRPRSVADVTDILEAGGRTEAEGEPETRTPTSEFDRVMLEDQEAREAETAALVGDEESGVRHGDGTVILQLPMDGARDAAPSWWQRTRGRRRSFRLYLPVIAAWMAAGGVGWWLFMALGGLGPSQSDVSREIEARLENDRSKEIQGILRAERQLLGADGPGATRGVHGGTASGRH